MPLVDLHRFTTPRALAATTAQRLFELSPLKSIALSGGRIAALLFESMVQSFKADPNRIQETHFFWADERIVPATHPESNFRIAHSLLFTPLSIQPIRIHRIPGELPPLAAAQHAEADLRAVTPPHLAGVSSLDLILLGLGEDGHVASLFPADLSTEPSGQLYRAVLGPKPPPNRVTMTYQLLGAAQQIWVLASGPGKAGALKRSFAPNSVTPLARLLATSAPVTIFTDTEDF